MCRVSKSHQNKPESISLDVQKETCLKEARKEGITNCEIIECIESAYHTTTPTILKLISKKKYEGCVFLLYDASRLSRNMEVCKKILNACIRNHCTIVLCTTGEVFSRENRIRQPIYQKVRLAQLESEILGRRVRDCLRRKKELGYHVGGVAKYGYRRKRLAGGTKLCSDHNEKSIIKFIKACRTINTPVNTLIEMLQKLSEDPVTMTVYNDDGDVIDILDGPLSFDDVADLLNDHKVLKRGREWTGASARTVVR